MTKPKTKALRFTHISLENWRNFTRVDVELQRRVFLVGANALGKSNFLDAFRFLHDVVSIGGGFQEAVRRRGGVSNLRCFAARKQADITIRVCIGEGERAPLWKYDLCFAQDKMRRPVIQRERVMRRRSTILARPDDKDKVDRERLIQTYLEQVNVNQSFRDVADFFSSVRYLHVVPQLIREPDRSGGRREDALGGGLLEQIAHVPEKTRTFRLERIVNALRVAVPQLKQLELWRDARGAPHLRAKYEHWRAQEVWQTEEQFSDGTLRLLGLLWATLDGKGPLLMEEPELSLHPDIVRFMPQMFARIQRRFDRQTLISTHSSDLLRDEGIGLDEVLILKPGEGTSISPASSFEEIKSLLEGGSPLADALIPQTRPENVEQLMLFPED